MSESFLSPRGRKYARYIFLVHRYCSNIRNRFIRKLAAKFVLSIVASFVYVAILKEGAEEDGKAKMSGMSSRVGASGKRTPGEVREMRIPDKRVSAVSSMVQTSGEGCDTERNTEEKNE